jgi:D-arabinose 1-dehydrogenase-like Zn-dependent alcohol dehydrogenase
MTVSSNFKTFHGTPDEGYPMVEGSYKARELKPNEVLIRITYSGVCGTDLHGLVSGMVLGHEGVGSVEGFGESVRGGWQM